ncbi:MAG TPA: 3-deoxy-D-manno-octulosonate 8-phosphate phosphatase [Candidatus Omnitrophota bacterium]|nr:3-deoxy-D-manno-octulosonate 8-phosphate phosphatase [Candidatus Omnitrophota bacterium]
MITSKLRAKFRKIKLLLLDVDGVLTDGRIIYDSKGYDSKFFDVHDGLGVHLLGRMGIKTILITAKGSKSIKPRAKDMCVEDVYADILPKVRVYEKVRAKYGLRDEEICFVGDDLVDLCVLNIAGLPVATHNATTAPLPPSFCVTYMAAGARSGK